MKSTIFLIFALLVTITTAATRAGEIDSPYGVCAHVSREEWKSVPQTYSKIREAGISFVRTDFDWKNVEPVQGRWQYEHLDRVVELARKENINILPILDYDVPWATPAWKYPDAWGEYVRRTVSRYAKELRCWEVWNEQNVVKFWGDTPNGTHYVSLLKRTCAEIRKIDPNLTILYGGTSGVPLDYIEESFRAGAGDYFDVMNIHPYHWRGTPEMMIAEIRNLKALMKKYNLENKPIWITETGWSTAQQPIFYREVLPAAFQRAGIDPAKCSVSIICDRNWNFSGALAFAQGGNLAMFRTIEEITLDQLRGLSVERHPVLVPNADEDFPSEYIPLLIDYLKRGGTILLPSGLPFYYDLRPDGRKVHVNDKYLKNFHIGWEARWTRNNVPEQESWQKPAPEFADALRIDFKPAGRFLHDRNLKPGDEFIPIILAGNDSYTGTVAALYKLNSDLKGNVIVCTTRAATETVPEKQQAEMLPRTYLIALANGVERIFWYNFRSGESKPDEREAHFGIVRRDFSFKPSFHAYQTLTRLCPDGSSIPVLIQKNDAYLAGWKRPDGTNVWAVWSSLRRQRIELIIKGEIRETLNHLGEKQPIPGKEFTATPSILYLVGPESVTVDAR